MAVTGDFHKLDQWQANLKELESGKYKKAAVKECGDVTLKLIREGFDREKDPFGQSWKPKVIPNGTKILRGPNRWVPYQSGRLRLFRVTGLNKDGFGVESMAPYFKFHQYGFKHNISGQRITSRKMVPGRVLPIRWSSSYQGVFSRHIKNVLKR